MVLPLFFLERNLMKKILFSISFIFLGFFFCLSNTYALTLKDGSPLTIDNFSQYVEELGYNYWRENIGSDYFAIIPIKNEGINADYFRFHIVKASNSEHQQYYNNETAIACTGFSCYHAVTVVFNNPESPNFDFTQTYMAGIGNQKLDYENAYSTFSFKSYDGSAYLMEPNFDESVGANTKHKVIFNIPDEATLVVKDKEGNIIESTTNNTYELKSGEYLYSVTKYLYYPKENVLFSVDKDITIDISLESKLGTGSMQSIFTQYYNYISVLVGDMFALENPLFLFLVSFIIGFSLITLIKKLIGGY